MGAIWHGIFVFLALLSGEPAEPNSPAETSQPKSVLTAPVADDRPQAPAHLEAQARDLALGHNHTCHLEDGIVDCWGSNHFGQSSVPDKLTAVIDIAAADQNTCALTSERAVCWGIDGDWERPVENGQSISTGGFHICGLDDNGPWCERGGNDYGENTIPEDLDAPEQIVAGYSHTCALDDGRVLCWGSNEFGEIEVPRLQQPTMIAAGAWYTCAIDGPSVICWGENTFGQLDVPSLVEPKAIMAGHNHACAIDRYGLQCWGRNAFGQAEVPSIAEVEIAMPGTHHTCAIADDEPRCWGYGAQGQLSSENDTESPLESGKANATMIRFAYQAL